MKTVSIWRIEDRDGNGPFHSKYLTDEEADSLFEADPWKNDKIHHLPWEWTNLDEEIDFRATMLGIEGSEFYSGSSSFEGLIKYFDKQKIEYLASKGFAIREYIIHPMYVVFTRDKEEAAFAKHHATSIKKETI